MTHPAASSITIEKSPPPPLWVLCVAKSNTMFNLPELFSYMGLPTERVVLVSDVRMNYMDRFVGYRLVGGELRNAELWNAGLNHIQSLHQPGQQWDVLMLDPAAPMSPTAVHSLCHHMRMTDMWMAEPDVFDTLRARRYLTTFEVDPAEVHPQTLVIAGESGIRLDRRFFDESDAWVEYCRRTRASGGSVRVSRKSLRESVL